VAGITALVSRRPGGCDAATARGGDCSVKSHLPMAEERSGAGKALSARSCGDAGVSDKGGQSWRRRATVGDAEKRPELRQP